MAKKPEIIEDPSGPRLAHELFGHSAAEEAFLKAWNSGRTHHAWLITGPRGIGKATLAYRIARFVLTQKPKDEEAGAGLFGEALPPVEPTSLALDPEDPIFQRIAAGGHGDLKVIERGYSDDKQTKKRSEIVIGDMRGVGQFMSMTPAEGGWRVVIIDAADEMNRNAANAVLKVLEEPPRQALMLLVCHHPGRLLPTIRSRCRTLALSALDEGQAAQIIQQTRPELSSQDAGDLAALSEGSPGKALDLLDIGGLDLDRQVSAFLAGLPTLDGPGLHDFCDKNLKTEDSFRTVGELLAWRLGRVIRAAATGQAVPGDEALSALAHRAGAQGGLDRWVAAWEGVGAEFARADGLNMDKKQTVLNAFGLVQSLARGL